MGYDDEEEDGLGSDIEDGEESDEEGEESDEEGEESDEEGEESDEEDEESDEEDEESDEEDEESDEEDEESDEEEDFSEDEERGGSAQGSWDGASEPDGLAASASSAGSASSGEGGLAGDIQSQPDGPTEFTDDAWGSDESGDGGSILDAVRAFGAEVFSNREDFPDTDEGDWEDDNGDWTAADYADSAKNFFGKLDFFGESAIDRWQAEGFGVWGGNAEQLKQVDEMAPGVSSTIDFLTKGAAVVAKGFVTAGVLELLEQQFPNIDFSALHVTVPRSQVEEGGSAPQPLPGVLAGVQPADAVDLRKCCPPIGDQGQTMRCSAFAWTHGLELARAILGRPSVRLSPSYTMMQFQKMQGDFRDYKYAWKGGDGTIGGTRPGLVLVEQGTCRQDLWPDESRRPTASDEEMERDASQYRLEADVHPIGIDDLRKVLSAGCPVHIAMTTGPRFSDLGRDGIFDAAEKPGGDHGYHAMLVVGYLGNYFIVKNSWGTDWGDNGYCYVPKKVLTESDPEFHAILVRKTPGGPSGGRRPAAAGVSLPQPAGSAPAVRKRFCHACGLQIPVDARFCVQCGVKVPT